MGKSNKHGLFRQKPRPGTTIEEDRLLRYRLRMTVSLSVMALLASACGGGGGGGSSPMMPACIETAEFGCISASQYEEELEWLTETHSAQISDRWELAAIQAGQAYANLELAQGSDAEPGAGVTIGLIDSGIDTEHHVFSGKTISEEFFHGAVDERGDKFSHGTAVASVIGAQPQSIIYINGLPFRSNSTNHGVAWGADLKMFAIPLRDPLPPGTPYEPISLTNLRPDSFHTTPFFAALDAALMQNVDILNLSISYQGVIENYPEQDIRNHLSRTIATFAQTGAQDKTILVWGAGNANGRPCTPGSDNCVGGSIDASSVEFFAGLAARIEELRGHSIAVVAVEQDGPITHFSNRCGIAADWCLAAPGDEFRAAYFGPDRDGRPGVRGSAYVAGTSFAAPMVSGGLAVMKQLFRDQLPNTALVTRLFATADKSGKFADREIYGQGMMDLGAATSPVGETGITFGNTVGSPSINIQTTSLRLGGALGDGLGRSLASQEIVAFDSLGAPFWFKLAGFTGVARGPSSLIRLRELTAQSPITQRTHGRLTTFMPDRAGGSIEQDLGYAMLRFGFRERLTGVQGGHFALADNATTLTLTGHYGMTVTAFTASRFAGRAPTSGAALSWRPFNVPVGFRAGWLVEQETLLGTTATGAFGRLSADAAMTGIETGFEIGKWELAALAEIGTARPRFQGGMLDRMSSLTTSAFAFNATRRLGNDGLVRISLSQPLRVEDGRAALSVPIGRTKDGDVLRQPVSANLVPSGRQIDVSAQWYYSLADDNELRFDATWIQNPGHNARAKPALSLLAGWRFEF